MIDLNKLEGLYKVIHFLIASDAASSFWKGIIPSTLELPKNISSMKQLFEELKKNPFGNDLSSKIRVLVELGKRAEDALNSDPDFLTNAKEKLSTFKIFKSLSRDPITTHFYETLAQLKNLADLSDHEKNILINEVQNKLLNLIKERNSVLFKPPSLVADLLHTERQEQLLKSQLQLKVSENRTIAYIFSNEPPSQVFQQGFKAGGFDRALFEGTLSTTVGGKSSMYILAHNQLDLKKAQQYQYAYVVDVFSPAIINMNNFPNNPTPEQSLVPRAIESGEIVGSFQLTAEEQPHIKNVVRNNEYKKTVNPGKQLLFRADSRHHSGDPSKDAALHVFQEGPIQSEQSKVSAQKKNEDLFHSGMKPWVNHSDSYKEYIDHRKPTIFISATDDLERALKFPEEVAAKEKRYIYVMYKPERAIQSLSVYKESQHALTDSEYLVPGGVPGEHIIGMYTYENGKYTSFDYNANSTINIGNDLKSFLEEYDLPIPENMQLTEKVNFSKFEI
ncbi:hypothetical protein [Legionella tucsonensis]|uniref:Uncharacterized protein n=2 Tax=Legionella tucsonensis TaxID=40335 RepID=A0A0W0ZTF4_9GAMM|nr:hypothetical protein [Legionella tucsonensis]KTD72465.1 hypothetical protein Ltuc_0312 [Legionella tucsonensis]